MAVVARPLLEWRPGVMKAWQGLGQQAAANSAEPIPNLAKHEKTIQEIWL